MANSQFLSDLSSGIFERLGSLRQEQQRRDDEQKLQTIGLLSNLVGQVEPDSRATLLKHLGDVIGVRGKLKGFWSSFSGLPDTSIEQQLADKVKAIASGTIGPQAATNVRAGGDLARLFQPTNPQQQVNQAARLQAEKDLQGKMILRDPRKERLEDIERASGLKFTQQQSMLEERERLLRERQAENDQRDFQNALKIRQQTEDLRAERIVNARAHLIARKNGFLIPNSDHLTQAAEEISKEQGLDLDLLRSRIGLTEAKIPLTQAQTTKAQLKAQTKKAQLSPTAVGKVNAVRLQRAVEDFERTKQALIDATSRGDQPLMTSLRKRLQTMATNLSVKFGDKLEVGSGEWPYVKPKGQSPSQGHGDNEISMDELREVAKRRGISLEQARTMAQAEGLIVR